MISTLLRISRTNLRRDRVAQMMVFVVPVVFFSIFAVIFGRQSMDTMPRLRVAVVDEDHSDMSAMMLDAMRADADLAVVDSSRTAAGLVPLDRERAHALVHEGNLPVAVILPKGWGATFPNLNGQGVKADVLADVSDPVARHMIVGLLQRSASVVLKGGPAAVANEEPSVLVATNVTSVMGDPRQPRRMVSFYAAGIAVMFLLFASAGASGALLDEQDSGTLERLLSTGLGMNGVLLGKWLHVMLTGILQVTVMFVWGMLAFHLDLAAHLPGFVVMTVFTAAAAAGLGLVLATASRTRQQLQGIANIVVLTMSALGGSMFPRFLMSEGMQKAGLLTFNAWALDGYVKVFWRDAPLASLAPQLGVLAALTVAFLVVARMLARRWETA